MKLLNRNLKSVTFCNYFGESVVRDVNGYETGEKKILYTDAKTVKCNVSPEKGKAQLEVFGNLDSYDKVLLLDNDYDIDENTVFFIDKAPAYDSAGRPLYDYVVRRVAKSLNSVSVAVSKVSVS